MGQRYDIVRIDFQANARGANAAIESLRVEADKCNEKLTELKKTLKEQKASNATQKELDNTKALIAQQEKLFKVYNKGYNELVKGMRTLDQGIKAFNDGTLAQMSAAFQKALYNAAKLTRTKLAPDSETYKKDYKELTAVMDASQQIYARLQGDAAAMLKTLKEGGKVSVSALREEVNAQKELLSVLAETDKGYKTTQKNVAVLESYLRAMGGDYAFVRQNITDTKKVSDDMLRSMYTELQKTNQEGKVTKDIMRDNAAAMKEIRTEQARRVESVLGGNLGQQSEQSIRTAIANAKELLLTYKTNSREAQALSAQIVNAEEHLKQYGLEAARAAAREAAQIKTQEEAERQLQATMNKRLTSLKTLSADALAESRKYWEAQRNGAVEGTVEFKKAENALKSIDNLQRNRRVAELDNVLTNPSKHGVAEVRNAVLEMEKLRDSVQLGIPVWQHYNKMVEQGRAYLDNLAKTDAAAKIEAQMQDLTTLSASGLQEVKKYWETMVAGAKHGSAELDAYKAKLDQVTAAENARAQASQQQAVGVLSGNLGQYSEAQIREAIEAGKQLIQTYKTADPEAQRLAKNIVAAEEHLKQYGLEAARTAQREVQAAENAAKKLEETHQAMEEQLRRGTGLTESALKTQENYWRRMADDPKAAANEIARYFENLNKVHEIQKEQEADLIKGKGVAALQFFRNTDDVENATGAQIQEQAKALKAYRDSLPRKDNADLLIEIDSYLAKSGQVAKEATGELMNLGEALEMAGKAGKDGFSATEDEIKKAIASIEKAIEIDRELVKQHRRAGNTQMAEYNEEEIKEYEKALKGLNLELKNVGISHERMQKILDNPINADNLDELRAAIKRAKAELNSMDGALGENRKQYDEMAKSVKKAEQQLKGMEGQAKGTASAFEKAWSRLKTYVGLYVGASVAMNKLMGTMGDLMDLSDKMGEVRKTTGFTADEVGRLSGELKKFDTRTTLNGLLDLSVAAGQLGLKTEEDVLGFTEAANKLMVALPEMGREGATEMLKVALATGEIDKIRKQMEQGLIDGSSATAVAMEKVGSTIDRLRATSAATAPAITDFVKRVGAVGAQSGISIDQVAALGSTVDALGMRVEMSATALSRMIPAIKNNAYQIGAMIGQTEESIISRFENGQGMDVILDIFQSIRDNSKMMTGDVEADAEAIEQAFEGAGLKDVMKELNQQGARAGIVFAGLSQNVDELRKHLETAADAYEENIAIEMEYMKMNETTAAKWERLKNQIEEFFVSDSAQRFLGGVIDLLRDIVDWLTGNNGVAIALRTIIAYMAVVKLQLVSIAAGALKAVGGGLKNIGIMLGFIDDKMTKIQLGNVFMAAAAAVWYLVVQLRQLWKDLHATEIIISETLASYNSKVAEATQKTEKLFEKVGNVRVAMKDATEEVKKAEEALKKTKEAMNAGTASAEDLEKAELNLKVAHEKETQANKDHYDTIRKINQEYSPYLGYMLSEISTAAELANARELINAKLRETILLKQKEAAYSRVESEFGGERDKRQSAAYETIGKNVRDPEAAARLRKDLMNLVKQEADKEKMNIVEFRKELNKAMRAAGGDWSVTGWQDFESEAWRLAEQERTIRDAKKRVDEAVAADIKAARTGTESTKGTRQEFEEQLEAIYKGDDGKGNGVKGLAEKYKKAGEKDRKQIAADLLMQMDAYETLLSKSKNFFDLKEEDEEKSYKTFIANSDKRMKDLGVQRDDLLKIAGDAYKPIQDDGKDKDKDKNKGRGPYGNYDKRVDPYEQWDANALVKRREDMLMRVRALAGGADVQQVLSMDKRFMDEATRKGIKNMRDAIAWYNTERLKIQEELDSRNLTNEGQWKDPKKGRSRKPKTPESEEAIAELDRYYLERKERIEEARANEEMTEAEYNRRLDALEQEHLERRSALRQTFTSKDKQFIQQFRQWWASVEELDEVSWETIEAEWIAAFDRDRKYNDRAAQKDLTQMQAIVVKQLREIESIIAKERPFNGITRNLQDNLTKMGLLFKDGVPEGDKFMQENTHRLTFLLKEAENAYNMTFDQLAEDMRKNGLGAWADAIINSENAEKEKRAVIAQLHEVYDAVQEAIKKEASLVKKQVDITWNDALLPNGKSIKATYEAAISQLGVQQNSVSRANSLIGAGVASERVADRLALRQMRLQLQMQEHYFNLVRQTGMQRIADLNEQARLLREQGKTAEAERLDLDAKHATMSLNLSLAKEETELAKQREDIIARTEESQNRLYRELMSWAELLASSMQSVFDASHAGDKEYYNERAKLDLTGKGGPGAGTYIVIEHEGSSDASAHYEHLDDRQALERQREIENQNAVADALKKVMDDLNMKMSETITDQLNAMLQNQSIDANTDATLQNTSAILGLSSVLQGDGGSAFPAISGGNGQNDGAVFPAISGGNGQNDGALSPSAAQDFALGLGDNPMDVWMDQQDSYTERTLQNQDKLRESQSKTSKEMSSSTQSAFAKMTAAANLYGIAYQTMSNDNLSSTQKFLMFAVQAAGQSAIAMLTTNLATTEGEAATALPGILGKAASQLGPIAGPIAFAAMSALLGGLMGLAVSKIAKSKSQISQVTGASVGAGRLATGMLTYGEGNVNEFTDPSTLTVGRKYNVDGADGKTYRARYMGNGAKTHITNGPEFHLVGEKGREAIIDARTTRNIQLNDPEIWRSIKVLYNGGRINRAGRDRGVAAFADGNLDTFDAGGSGIAANGTGGVDIAAMTEAMNRQAAVQEALLERLNQPIVAQNVWTGPDGIPNMYNKMEKEARRHGVKYL